MFLFPLLEIKTVEPGQEVVMSEKQWDCFETNYEPDAQKKEFKKLS